MNNHTENNIALLTKIIREFEPKTEVQEKQIMQLQFMRELLLIQSRELNESKKRKGILNALNNMLSIDLLYKMVK